MHWKYQGHNLEPRLKVFGIGLVQTGTTVLGECLRQLKFRHLGYDSAAFKLWQRGKMQDIFSLVEDHDSFSSWPWPFLFTELDQRFPNSKFILTESISAESWFDALCRELDQGSQRVSGKLIYDCDLPHHNKQALLDFYEEHSRAVRSYFQHRSEHLLEICWDEGSGWQELSEFLDVAPPVVSFPYAAPADTSPLAETEKVTVAVPFYNVEEYIDECLDSVVKQTYRNLEILCIDDCSEDNSSKIVEEFARRDDRIRVVRHEVNQGLGGARNTAIEQATGDYICFVDSDDYVSSRLVEALYIALKRDGADLSVCGFHAFDGDSRNINFTFKYENAIYELQHTKDNVYEVMDGIRRSTCLKLYRRGFLLEHALRQPIKQYYEGVVFWLQVAYYCSKITVISDVLYYYRQRPGSIMTTFSKKHIDDRLDFLVNADDFFKSKILETPGVDENRVTRSALTFLVNQFRYGQTLLDEAEAHSGVGLQSYYTGKIRDFADTHDWPALYEHIDAENQRII